MKTIIKVNGITLIEMEGTIECYLGYKIKVLGEEYVIISRTIGPCEIEIDCISVAKFEGLI